MTWYLMVPNFLTEDIRIVYDPQILLSKLQKHNLMWQCSKTSQTLWERDVFYDFSLYRIMFTQRINVLNPE